MNIKIMLLYIGAILLALYGFSSDASADSRLIRGDKDLFVSSTIGLHIPTLVAMPVSIGYYSDPDLMYGIEYAKRDFDYDDNSVVVENGKIENSGVNARYFFSGEWDSLNVMASFNKRNFDVDVRVNIQDPVNTPFGGTTKYTQSHLAVEVYTLSLGIGNQWIWDSGIYLGIDWFMPSFVLAKTINSTINTDSENFINTSETNAANKDLDDLGKSITNIAGGNGYLMLTLGMAF